MLMLTLTLTLRLRVRLLLRLTPTLKALCTSSCRYLEGLHVSTEDSVRGYTLTDNDYIRFCATHYPAHTGVLQMCQEVCVISE